MLASVKYRENIEANAERMLHECDIKEGRLLVSGATGLIGTALIDCLMVMNDKYKTNYKVVGIAKDSKRAEERLGVYFGRQDFEFVSCDVNQTLPEMGDVDYVIHAASNTHPISYSTDPVGTIRTNVTGTENMIEYMRMHKGKRFIFLSSVEIYGQCREGQLDFAEEDCGYINCNQLRAGYPESKRVGESMCCAYGSQYGLDVLIARLCRVYGPTMLQDDSKALSQFIRKAVQGEDIVLKSNGQQFYSYIHVLDAVRAIMFLLDKGIAGEAYNVSADSSNVKLCELADMLAGFAGKKVVYELPDETERQGYSKATRAILKSDKLNQLGWKESYDIYEGLQMTIEVMRQL